MNLRLALLCGPAALLFLRGDATSAASASQALGTFGARREDGDSGPLLACDVHSSDSQKQLNQLFAAFQMANIVCCEQLGETCGPSAIGLPTSCSAPKCARAVQLVSDSCGALVSSPTFPVGIGFKPLLDAATAVCAAAVGTRPDPHRYAVTDPASASVAAAATGASITDGMGAGGHKCSVSWQDAVTVQAAAGETSAVTIEVLYLIDPHDYMEVYVDDALTGIRFHGTHLKIFPEEQRTLRSKAGGKVTVRSYRDDGDPGHAGFFSFRVIACASDAGCNGHGSCDTATGACSCRSAWEGRACTGARFRVTLGLIWSHFWTHFLLTFFSFGTLRGSMYLLNPAIRRCASVPRLADPDQRDLG